MEKVILGVNISEITDNVSEIHTLISMYGNIVKTRLGLHNIVDDHCSNSGILILELSGDLKQIENFENKLKEFENLEVQKMVFKK